MIDCYVQQVTTTWYAQGYEPHEMELWEMLCGYLALHDGARAVGLLPKVLQPLLLDEPRANAVRVWCEQEQVLPILQCPRGGVMLLPDWRERLRQMRQGVHEALASVDYQAFGYVPWYYHLDFPDEDALCQDNN